MVTTKRVGCFSQSMLVAKNPLNWTCPSRPGRKEFSFLYDDLGKSTFKRAKEGSDTSSLFSSVVW